jgi:hypothetical protein
LPAKPDKGLENTMANPKSAMKDENRRGTTWKEWILVGLLLGVLFVIECVVVRSTYTVHAPGIADFYSRWAGARALLLEGRDPYSLDVTREIQHVLRIDTSQQGKGGFAYPLYVLFTFGPLIYLSYDWVQAIWMVTLQWLAVATALVLSKVEQWKPSPLGLVGLCLGTVLFYPVTRTIMLGQFTVHVTFFLVLALWALQQRRDGWAGAALAATTIKPQMVLLIGPWLVLWAVGRRRWRVIGGLLAGGGLLLLASLLLFPRWPISFVEDVLRYSQVAGGRTPLAVLKDLIWPGAPEAARYGLAGLLLLVMLATWRRGWQDDSKLFANALHWTIVVSLLVPFQTGTTNQVLLLIPLLGWLHQVLRRWGRWWALITAASLVVIPWILFLSTIHGDWEDPVLFLPLPLFGLVVLIGIEVNRWQQRQRSAVSSSPGTLS